MPFRWRLSGLRDPLCLRRESGAYPISDEFAHLVGTIDVLKSIEQDFALNEAEVGCGPRESEILGTTGTQLAKHQVVWFHATTNRPLDLDVERSRFPIRGRVRWRTGGHSLSVVAMFGIEGTCFSEYERDLVRKLFLITRWNDVYVTRRREFTLWRIRNCGQNGSRADNINFL